jgi:hypothetical protein
MTQLELDTFVANSQCCIAEKSQQYIQAKNNGDMNTEKYYYEWIQLTILVASIQDYDITSTCFTEDELCTIVQMIRRMCAECGC